MRRLVILLLGAALLGMVLLLALPHAIDYGLRQALRAGGAVEVELQRVHVNPFTGTLRLSGLRLGDGKGWLELDSLDLGFEWRPLLQRRLHIRRLSLSGLRVELSRSGRHWRMAGLARPLPIPAAPPVADTGWALQLDRLTLAAARLDLRLPQWHSRLHVRSFEIGDLDSARPQQPLHLALTGALNGRPLTLSGEIHAFAPRLHGRLRLRAEGQSIAPYAGLLPADWRGIGGLLDARLRLDFERRPAGLQLRHEGRLTLREAALETNRLRFSGERLAWQGKGRFELGAVIGLFLQGRLEGRGLALAQDQPRLRHAARRLAWGGRLDWPALDAPGGLRLQGTLDGVSLRTEETERAVTLLALQWLKLDGVEVEGPALVRLAGVDFQGGEGLVAAPLPGQRRIPLLGVGAGTLRPVTIRGREIDIGQVRLQGLRLRLRRDATGRWLVPPLPAGGGGMAVRLRLTSLELAEGGYVELLDAAVTPAVKSRLAIEGFRLAGLDTGDAGQPVRLYLAARPGEYARLQAEGWLKPFGEALSSELQLKLERLDLPPLSPYAEAQFGYRLESGTLDLDSELKIEAGRLQAENDVRLHRLAVQRVSEEKAAEVEKTLAMPLETALDMLRDKQGDIHLQLPVAGLLTDPAFDPSDAIRQALAKTLKTAAVGYLKYALQPYSTLFVVGKFLVDKAGRLRLEPLRFAPGASEPDAAAGDYLARIARLLDERPALQLRICAFAVARDRAMMQVQRRPARVDLETALLNLADARAAAVRRLLVETHGIDPARLLVCRSQIDAVENAEPRVELAL
ncbi:DUF748 domain-containing protein [Thiohalobacter sp. IOR34]|uniref:DUF748 domain-containing protein n=1 Tax=Thiohalobacter sp. IOR34 TaxID=3057176 RepID=UPI0025AF01D4|nr:DUF748 domain-containing protein [Thiohalobacter sp. IOR34]WJW76075.1 DUF748 domain-containing protein [Thiohalobacter sp. IOR34]